MRRASLAGARRKPTRIGISTGQYLQNLDTTTRGLALDAIVSLGGKWVREAVVWADVQATNSVTFDWTKWDSLVSQCNARGLKILGVIGSSPAWARPTTYAAGDATSPPDSSATFATFCADAVTRYKASIQHWEVWNEPNVKQYWGGASAPFDPSTAVYYGMLSAAYTAMKAADPTCTIITGGLAPSATGSGYLSPIDFLDGILTAGAGSKCDGYGHHPYSYPLLPSSTFYEHAWAQMVGTTPSMLSTMDSHSARKPFWITEVGAPTYGTGTGATVANHYGVDLYPPLPGWVDTTVQSNICNEVLSLSRQYPGLIAFVAWYNLADTAAPGVDTDREKHFGLLENGGTPKTAAGTFAALVAATGGPA